MCRPYCTIDDWATMLTVPGSGISSVSTPASVLYAVNNSSDDDEPETEECPWSYLDLRRDFYAEVRKMKWPHPRFLDPCPPRSLPA